MSKAIVARRTRFVDPQAVQRRLKVADFTVLLITTLGAFLGSSLLIPAHATPVIGFFALEVALGSVLMMNWIGLYGLDVLLQPSRGIPSALTVTAGLGAVVFVSTHLGLFPLEPLWLAGWLVVGAAHFTLTRAMAYLWAKPRAAAGAFRQRVAVVGWGEEAEDAVRLLKAADPLRLEAVGVFEDRAGRAGGGAGAMGDLIQAAGERLVDMIVVAIPFSAENRLLETLKQLWPLPADIRIAAQANQVKLSPRAYGYLGKLPLLSVFDRPLKRRRRAKNLVDWLLAALLIVILLPVLILAAVAVLVDSGRPVLVRERRFGFDGAAIGVYRFNCGNTWLGRALRRIGIDGLPQLLNVMEGELSLVGPRLHSAEAPLSGNLYQQVVEGYFARHGVKPGITGWAQINGWPDGLSFTDRTARHDLEYVDRWSLLFDLYILVKSPFSLLRKGAAG